MLDYLVIGCGRSGSHRFADICREAGYTVGHEKMFDWFGIHRHYDHEVEVSWFASPDPYRHEFVTKNTMILHLVRHPYKVVRSWLARGGAGLFILKDPMRQYCEYFAPEVFSPIGKTQQEKKLNVIVKYYLKWNEYAERWARKRIKIEDVKRNPLPKKSDKSTVARKIEFSIDSTGRPFLPGSVNPVSTEVEVPSNLIHKDLVQSLKIMSSRYGYDTKWLLN